MTCPLDCPYLQEAHRHERFPPANPDEFPNRDIKISDDLLKSNEALLVFTGRKLMTAALETPGNVGPDLSEIGNAGRSDQWLYNYVFDARVYNPKSAMPPWVAR